MDKVSFFNALDALNDSSDEEEDTNSLKGILPRRKPSLLISSSTSSRIPVTRRSNSEILKRNKIPGIHRTISAPLSSTSIVEETPPAPLQRKTSLLRHNVSPSLTPEPSLTTNPISSGGQSSTSRPPAKRRAVSTPTIGSVFMDNSKGVKAMLKGTKKGPSKPTVTPKKRKSVELPEVPDDKKVFKGLVFYWIPEDENSNHRKTLMAKARSHGAVIVRDLLPSITHVVVEEGIKCVDVVKKFKGTFNMDIPSDAHLVIDKWSNDCSNGRFYYNPNQRMYKVPGFDSLTSTTTVETEIAPAPPNPLEESLEIKKSVRRKSKAPSPTPEQSTQDTPQAPFLGTHIPGDDSDLVGSPNKTGKEDDVQYESFDIEMDEMIRIAKGMQHLPINDDEDDNEIGTSSSNESIEDSDQSGSEGEREEERRKKRKLVAKAKAKKGTFNQENFSCMTGGTGLSVEDNPNYRTIEVFEEMGAYYTRMGDTWRSKAYRQACGALKRQSTKISTYEQAIKIHFIGSSIASKLEEIVLTNRLRKLDMAKMEPNDKILQLFMKVYGSGVRQANKWIQSGYKTLDDLRASGDLTKNQKIGVDHFDDFNTRIPREEVTMLGQIVKDAASKIDHHVEIIIGGSYRRGAVTSGDIDCLITKKDTLSTGDFGSFLWKLVDRLTQDGFLVAALAVPGNRRDSGSKWHGACVLPGPSNPIWRRIDLLLVPETEFGAALIYFTGDDIFNRSLRLLASHFRMRLNQRGLYKDVIRGPGREKLTDGELVEGADEKKIFEVLRVPWREPENRIMH